jgi:hypothetical protein
VGADNPTGDSSRISSTRPSRAHGSSLAALARLRALSPHGAWSELLANGIHVEMRSDDVGPDLGLPHPLHLVVTEGEDEQRGRVFAARFTRRRRPLEVRIAASHDRPSGRRSRA